MNLLKNRKVLGVLCIGIAAVTAFGLNTGVAGDKTVVKIKEDLMPGQVIEDKHVTTMKISGDMKDTFEKKTDVVGKYAATKLFKDEVLIQPKVAEIYGDGNQLGSLDESNNATSITIKTFAKGLSGKLQKGDIVSIIHAGQSLDDAVILPELTYVEILAVTAGTGADTAAETENEDGTLPAAVTLKVSPAQAVKLAAVEENGNAHIVLVSRGNQEKAKELLQKQAGMLAQAE